MIRSIKLIKKKINTLYAKYKTKKLEDLLILDDNQDNPPLNGNKYLIISLVLLFVGTFLLDLYRCSRWNIPYAVAFILAIILFGFLGTMIVLIRIETSKPGFTTISSIISISTLIYSTDWKNSPEWTFIVLILMIGILLWECCYAHDVKINHQKAQKIFQVQLLLDEPVYKELKKCYYHGGEKYKEKLLSTEKFLIEILQNELQFLKILDSYENYLLYKTFYSKTLVISSKNNNPPRLRKSSKLASRRMKS
ncbi:hypothetical protein K1J09_00645 [Streptococcus sanguinis]|uniref:hypothetical protein n=1 Tax=Streptococcus sanguinis TaxID=1305 RepID=UPI001CC080B9|nr:hypothetical protein [Streptococcus sanguinis]MBZ2022837.1 hypothetical protein [Streptococcus sanguinis]MBZ2047535.1 hypothetical protein [Streptococcus sanguinis]MBZ2049771.1 hypothetical protein [Streptococcus sanguinis]MBZ2059104.1 hypothetical protein [Streptococcus sanguinis]MCC3178315.1 mutG lantibiotic protection ABC superfamily ATP binding cassette transporter permease subunit [Streptococcus sanguinis]